MLRIATIQPPGKVHDTAAWPRANRAFQVTHSVGDASANAETPATSLDELLLIHSEFDACAVHIPISDCFEQIKGLAKAGKHILLASPSYDIATLEQLKATCDTSGARLVVAQERRFTPYARSIRETLDANDLGNAGLLRIHRWEQTTPNATQAMLWNMSVHEVDLACWLFGAAPTEVFGQSILSEGGTDGLLLHLGFANGMALIDCAFHQGSSFYTASLIGERGAAYADDHHNTNLLLKKNDTRGLLVTNNEDGMRLQLESFALSVASDLVDQSVSDMKLAIKISHAAVQSAGKQRAMKRIGDQYELQ